MILFGRLTGASDALQEALFRAYRSLRNVEPGRPFYPWEELWRAVQTLSPAHRAVVVLRYFDDLSEQEMAEALAVSPGTVKSRLHYARNALEKQLRRGWRNE